MTLIAPATALTHACVARTIWAVTLTCLSFSGQAQDLAKPEYETKPDQPALGSNIKSARTWGSNVPVNRRYAEFSQREKDILNSRYENMGPGDEPPFPVEGLKPLYNLISKASNEIYALGKLSQIATINSAGDAIAVKTFESPDSKLSNFTARLLFETKFKPALCRGVPCQMDFLLETTFVARRFRE